MMVCIVCNAETTKYRCTRCKESYRYMMRLHEPSIWSNTLNLSADANMQIDNSSTRTLGSRVYMEHSYSLNSDGDSIPNSPRSDPITIDDTDDESYPDITMINTPTTSENLMDICTSSTRQTALVPARPMPNKSRLSLKKFKMKKNKSASDSSAKICETSEIDVEDCSVEDKPMSQNSTFAALIADMEAFTNPVLNPNSDLLKLSAIAQSPKKPKIKCFTFVRTKKKIVLPKLNTKLKPKSSHVSRFPLSPPISLLSDNLEGNQNPTPHLTSPIISSTISSSATVTNSSASIKPETLPSHTAPNESTTEELMLTEEEKRLLVAGGYNIPKCLPLTLLEEHALKVIRRKIQKKNSSQALRVKKREHLAYLESKVKSLTSENLKSQQRIEHLEALNESLRHQLENLNDFLNIR